MRAMSAAALLLLLLSPEAWAQARRAPVLLELPVSVRAAGMGHAFMLGTVDASAIFHNAAHGESLRGIATSAHVHGRRSTALSAAAGLEWWGGSVAVGVQSASYAPDPGTLGEAAGQLFGEGATPVAEAAASVALARRVRGIRVGVTGKWLEQRVGVERNGVPAADIAASLPVGRVVLGLAVQNLGPAMPVGGGDVPLPDRVTLGAGTPTPMPLGPFDLGGAAAVGRDTRGDFFAGGGLELSWWPVVGRTFSVRAGSTTRGADPAAGAVTLGAGFTGDRIALDYAFQSFGDRGDAHRIGLRWR
jgi:hypothetical protein